MLEQRRKLKKLLQTKSANEAVNNSQFVFALWLTNLKGRCPSSLQHTRIARAGCALWEPGGAQLLLKAERTILQDSYFWCWCPNSHVPCSGNQQSATTSCRFTGGIFPFPHGAWNMCVSFHRGFPHHLLECVQCPQPPATLGRAEFLGLQLLLQKS